MSRKLALVLSAPLLLTAACADEADEGSLEVRTGEAAVSALRAAPDAVADAGTAQVEVVMAMTMMGEDVEITAAGSVDRAAQQMAMEMDMGALFDQIAESTGEDLPEGLGGAFQMVADGATFYMRAPMFEMMGVDGWISMTPEDLGSTAQGLGFGPGAYDFSQTLETLRGVDGDPDVIGEEDVRGVATTHYRASMNLARALEEVPADQRDQVEAAFEQLGGGDDLDEVDIPVDVWVDADDLPRRMRIDMGSLLGAPGMGEGGATMTMEMFGYGEPVDIDVPSADEVVPIEEALSGLGAGFGS